MIRTFRFSRIHKELAILHFGTLVLPKNRLRKINYSKVHILWFRIGILQQKETFFGGKAPTFSKPSISIQPTSLWHCLYSVSIADAIAPFAHFSALHRAIERVFAFGFACLNHLLSLGEFPALVPSTCSLVVARSHPPEESLFKSSWPVAASGWQRTTGQCYLRQLGTALNTRKYSQQIASPRGEEQRRVAAPFHFSRLQ